MTTTDGKRAMYKQRYEDADERVVYEVDQASFAEHWGFRPMSLESFNEELHGEDWDPSLVFLAQASGTTVGYVVSFLFEMCGYVGILGVLRSGAVTGPARRCFVVRSPNWRAGVVGRSGWAWIPRTSTAPSPCTRVWG